MQEGTLALMQLAKTLAAIERLRAGRVPFISVLSDPTTGGVFASFAAVGDVNVAEPNALIGFAGARVPAGTIAQELPAGFQRAEFLFSHGFIDRVVPRADMRDELMHLLRLLPVGNGHAPDRARRGGRAGLPPAVIPVHPGRSGGGAGRQRQRGVDRRRDRDRHRIDQRCRRRAGPDRRRADGRRLGPCPAGPQPAPAAHARVRRGDDRRVRRAAWRPPVRRRRGHGRGSRAARWAAGRGHRPAEGRRHGREHPAQLRDAPPGGLPQGDAGHGAGRAVRPAGRHVRGRPGRPPRPRIRGARHRRGDRPVRRR